jgi:GT2 family glycosyltransferase
MQCLSSIERQKNEEIEVIVVDNASSDGSPEMVKEYFPFAKLIQTGRNLGFAKANNIGIGLAKGKYIALVNSDVRLLDGCLQKLYEFMEKNPEVGIAGPKLLNPDLTLQDSCRKFPSLWNNLCEAVGLNRLFPKSAFFSGEHMTYFNHDRTLEVDGLVGAFLLVRRKAIEGVGLMDERFFIYSEEIDWCKRFRDNGWKIIFFPGAEAIHVGRASSSNDPLRFSIAQEKARFQYWEKHHGLLTCLGIKAIFFLHYMIRLMVFALAFLFRPSKKGIMEEQLRKRFLCLRELFSHKGSSGEKVGHCKEFPGRAHVGK